MSPKGTKITVDLWDEALYKAVKIAAVEHGTSLRGIVVEALRDWLRRQEEEEDLAAYEEAKGDETRPYEEFWAELEQENNKASA
ncbi:MAG: hypothetical protein HYU86_04615 [Chloroflexi bacterium]|nr:hypothetical protein [Chloroflexota bacterium]